MKRLLIFITAFMMFDMQAWAVTMCAKQGTYMDVFYKDRDGTPEHHLYKWKVSFDYDNNQTNGAEKIITGIAACNGISGTYGVAKTNLYTDESDVGIYCWCRMKPVGVDDVLGTTKITGITSYWIYADVYSTETDCASGCASKCATWVSNNNNDFRTKLFEAIW